MPRFVSIALGVLTVSALLPVAAPAKADSYPKLHVVAVTTDGGLVHALNDGGYWSGFGDIEFWAGDIGTVETAEAVVHGGETLHVFAIGHPANQGTQGQWTLQYTARFYDGNWASFSDIPSVVPGNPFTVHRPTRLAVCSGSVGVHLFVVTDNGELWHTQHLDDGSWVSWQNALVNSSSTFVGYVYGTSCAVNPTDGTLHVALTSSASGKTWHAIKGDTGPAGQWFQVFGNVDAAVNDHQPSARDIDIAISDDTLHVVMQTVPEGPQTHTMRFADGSWQQAYGHVPTTGLPPSNYNAAWENAVAASADGLHVLEIWQATNELFHTLRKPDGSWEPYENLGDLNGSNLGFLSASIASQDLIIE